MTTTSIESYAMVAGNTAVVVLGLLGRMDGYYQEEHRAQSRTTEYPVETGADLTDHVVREPYRLKLKGSATEYQRGTQAGLQAWAAILAHINKRQPIAVVTRLGTYYNMILVDSKVPVSESTGLSLDIEMEFKEILRANVTRGTVRSGGTPTTGPAVDRAPPPVRRGSVLPLAGAGGKRPHSDNSAGGQCGSGRAIKGKPRTRQGWFGVGL